MGGVLTGLVLAKNQSNQLDKHLLSEVLPTLGVSSALTLPLVKSLLTNRWPNATLELAFYDKQGHFESRQQVGLSKTGYGDWQQLHVEGRATQDGYVKFRLRNHNKLPVYWDDITLQINTISPDNALVSEAVVGKRSSTGGFPASVSTAPQEIYRTGGDPCGGYGGYDLITDTWYRDPQNGNLLPNIDVTADAPTYTYGQNNTIIYTDPKTGSTYPATASSSVGPGHDIADITVMFNQQLEKSKNHFCQQAAAIRADYPSDTPNWAAPGDPQSGLVARLLRAFANDVANNAPYDLKTQNFGPQNIGPVSAYNGSVYKFDAYGNINYGLAAAASGIPLSIAVCSAGIYQIGSSTGPVDFSNLSGCLDNSVDSAMIGMGYQIFNGCENGVRTNNAQQN